MCGIVWFDEVVRNGRGDGEVDVVFGIELIFAVEFGLFFFISKFFGVCEDE